VGVAGVLVLFVAIGALLVYGRPELPVIWLFVAAALLLVFYVSADPQGILDWLRGRQARYGANTSIMAAAFIGILILVNFLANQHSQLWDITSAHRFTLTKQTLDVLASLKQPVTMTAFYANSGQGNSGKKEAQQLLDQYTQHSTMVKVSFVDPDQQPGIAQEFNVRSYGAVVVQSGTQKQTVEFGAERDYTSAIIKVTSAKAIKLYFLTGHGEKDITDSADTGLQAFSDALKKIGFDNQTLNLTNGQQVPEDAAGIIIAAPQKDLQPEEVTALVTYLNRGGHVAVLMEAYPKADLSAILATWGVAIDNGIIVDAAQNLRNVAVIPGVQQYGPSAVTKNLQGLATFYQNATSLTLKTPAPAGVTVTPIIQTSVQSWESKSPDHSKLDFNAQTDQRGPLVMGVVVTKATNAAAVAGATPTPELASGPSLSKETRLMVVGNVNWVSNLYLRAATIGNQDLALAMANWIAEQDQQIDIPPPPTDDRTLLLTGTQTNLVLFGNFLFIPALVFLGGVYVWFRRR
jgi:ABC-type uncharacterized transport system involved in gliding motility auxiliary subunit